MKPVFIIGGSRTGSELLKNIIRKYTEIDFVPEMFMLSPGWLHKDFKTSAEALLDKNSQLYDVQATLDLIYSGDLYGFFWTRVEELDRSELQKKIDENGSTLYGIFKSILQVHAKVKNKSVPGAKFPVHYSRAHMLKEWFPECKIIHTTRDPRAIYVSQSNKYTKSSNSYLSNVWIKFKHFTHIVIQSLWTAKIHNEMKGSHSYYLFKYEDFLSDPVNCMKNLSSFLEVEYRSEMAEPEIYSNSSFNDQRGTGRGLQTSSASSWKKRINPLTKKLMNILCGRAMKVFNY